MLKRILYHPLTCGIHIGLLTVLIWAAWPSLNSIQRVGWGASLVLISVAIVTAAVMRSIEQRRKAHIQKISGLTGSYEYEQREAHEKDAGTLLRFGIASALVTVALALAGLVIFGIIYWLDGNPPDY